jgi:hypothetical protein
MGVTPLAINRLSTDLERLEDRSIEMQKLIIHRRQSLHLRNTQLIIVDTLK